MAVDTALSTVVEVPEAEAVLLLSPAALEIRSRLNADFVLLSSSASESSAAVLPSPSLDSEDSVEPDAARACSASERIFAFGEGSTFSVAAGGLNSIPSVRRLPALVTLL